jgi:hypothetical protein
MPVTLDDPYHVENALVSLKTQAHGQTDDAMTRADRTTADREARLRRSLRRLNYDLVDADARGLFYIQRPPIWSSW